jgi:hypothetical protein
MDLTDLTITPMMPVGVAVATALIKAATGWSLGVSLLAAAIPGAGGGFIVGVGLFYVISWSVRKLSRVR